MNPHDAAHALAKSLRESADFKELKGAQAELKTDQSARSMLLDFRNEQLEVQKQQLSGVKIAPEQEEKLEKLYEVINMNNTIKRFLQAEYRVAVLLRDIHKIIGDATEEIIDPELMTLPEDKDGNSEE
ncbi:MAG: YlbF family regulator [Dethiobacteria bacterium]|nr:YlbF family regulator [Bacillota bacterium]MDW7729182.1 YlbF family regulator [Bacillota bacterium]